MPDERAAPRPVTQADYDQIRALHAQGLGRNEIMRAIDRSANVVSRLAREMGLSFVRGPEVEAATEARRQDLAARRTLLAEQLLADAEALREQLWQPAVVFNFGGAANSYEEHTLPEPPAADKKALMATLGIAVDRSLKLVPADTGDGADTARSVLLDLADGIRRIAGEDPTEEG